MNIFTSARQFCILGAMALSPLFSAAQGPALGVKVGLNMSNLYSGNVDDNNMRLGFNGGVFGRTNTASALGIQAELLYSTKGNSTTYHAFFDLIDQQVDFSLNYLELPLMASFRFADQAIELQAGGYVGYLLGANVTTSGDLGSGSNTLDRSNFNSMDAGLVLGAAFNAGPAQIGARYEFGLSQIANSDDAKFLLGDAKNSCIQVYVAVGVPGERK